MSNVEGTGVVWVTTLTYSLTSALLENMGRNSSCWEQLLKKPNLKKIYTFYVNFHFLNIFFQFEKIILLTERLNNID